MRYSAVAVATLVVGVSAHGVITEIQGANGVTMPGLSVVDGTPRDCAQASCGSQDDTAIIRARDINSGRATPLGRNKAGPITADTAVAMFMSGPNGAATQAAKRNPFKPKPRRWHQARDIITDFLFPKREETLTTRQLGNLLGGLLGGGAGGGGGAGNAQGTATPQGTAETGVSRAAGTGATSGMPTVADDGTVSMTFHQINQDGAGPLQASIDPTSGGTEEAAFQEAQVTQNVPGIVGGLSLSTNMDFPIKVQMPAGMTCEGTVAGATNTCVLRAMNNAAAGPFGGSVAFTQTAAQRKRAIAYRMKTKRFAAKRSLASDLQALVDAEHGIPIEE